VRLWETGSPLAAETEIAPKAPRLIEVEYSPFQWCSIGSGTAAWRTVLPTNRNMSISPIQILPATSAEIRIDIGDVEQGCRG
jgi:hypothetical protein